MKWQMKPSSLAVSCLLAGLVCLAVSDTALAQDRTLTARGSQALNGLSHDDARAFAIGKARDGLARQVAAAIADMPDVKSVKSSPEAIDALARGILNVSVADGAGPDPAVVTVTATFNPATMQVLVRKILADEDLMQRMMAAAAKAQSALVMPPSALSARLVAAQNEYQTGTALWLTGGAEGLNPAVEAFSRAVTSAPDYAPAWTARGSVRVGLSQLERGLADLDKGVALDPKSNEALRARAAGYMAQLKYAQAEQDLNKAIELDPKDAASRNARGELNALLKRNDRALADFDEAIRLAPNYAIPHYNKGALLSGQQKPESAMREYDTALRLDPTLTLALNNRGNLYARMKQYDKALKDLDEAVRLDSEFAAAFNNRGEVHRAKGEIEKAIADFDEAIKFRPTYANAYINRAAALEEDGKVDLAFRDLEFASKLIPPNATLYAYRGSAYARLSLPAKACQEWKKACELGEKSVCEFLKKPDVCEAELPEN